MVRTSTLLALVAASATSIVAQKCSSSSHCPESAPCCSQFGDCGVGAYCLGGCDPIKSFSIESCAPAPVCKGGKYDFKSMDRVTKKAQYLGDASKTDWVMDGEAIPFDGNVLLTMAPDTVGTVLASSTYLWYGNVKAKFRTSRGAGVVTAFILFSDVQDEIDYEFVGVDLETAQTNYYFQGITNYGNSANISLSNTFTTFHTYEIDWTPDQITWKIDGQVGRVKKRSETWNATDNQWHYPQTPARVQLSLWPGGLETNAKGTIDWAGGKIDWNSADIQRQGYYYAIFESVEITCYDADKAPGTNKGTAYWYTDKRGTNDTVVDGKKNTILKSLQGTGTDMDKELPSSAADAANSSGSKAPESVPGQSGMGVGSPDRGDGDDDNKNNSPQPSQSAGSIPENSGDSTSIGNSFQQNVPQTNTNKASQLGAQDTALRGSFFAVVVAFMAMMAL